MECLRGGRVRGQNALFKIAMKQYLGSLMIFGGGGRICLVLTLDFDALK